MGKNGEIEKRVHVDALSGVIRGGGGLERGAFEGDDGGGAVAEMAFEDFAAVEIEDGGASRFYL